MTDIWRPAHVTECADNYQISAAGRVRSNNGGRSDWKDVVVHANRKGYFQVGLWHKNRRRTYLIHHLVLGAFGPERPEGFEAAHLNGVRTDNRIDNLKWASSAENHSHKALHGTLLEGEKHHQAKLTNDQVRTIRAMLAEGRSTRELASHYGVTQASISSIKTRKTWKNV